MRKIFGTDGIREIPGNFPLIPEVLEKILHYFSERYKNVLLGFDTRESSPEIAAFILDKCEEFSLNCELADFINTSAISYLTKKESFDIGIVITASHNPYFYNGVKFFNSSGEKLRREEELKIEKFLSSFNFPEKSDFNFQGKRDILSKKSEYYRNLYTDWIKENFSVVFSDFFEKYKFALDLANGSLSVIVPEIFKGYKNVKIFFHTFDGKNINRDCGATEPEVINDKVRRGGFDYGVSFDGDGDRLIVCDGERTYSGDEIIFIFANYLKRKGRLNNNIVCGTILSSLGLEISLKDKGVTLLRSDVGDRNVYYLMKERDAILGGEESGHIILRELLSTGDGLLSFLFLCEILRGEKSLLKDLLADFYRTSLLKYNIPYVKKKEIDKIDSLNYLKNWLMERFGNEIRTVVRYSGTEKYLRIVIEGKNEILTFKKDIEFFIKKIGDELK